MKTQPRYRWFRFSLRTLFVGLTLFSVVFAWVAIEARISMARARELELARKRGAGCIHFAFDVQSSPLRRLLGDKPLNSIVIHSASREQIDNFREAFPETYIMDFSDGKTLVEHLPLNSPTP